MNRLIGTPLYPLLRVGSGLPTFWWRIPALLRAPRYNFGDELTPAIVESQFARKCVWRPPSHARFAGAGSIVEMLQRGSKGNRLTLWGSGFLRPGPSNSHANLDFRAVRGKLSLARVSSDRPVALGDPGLLAPLVFPRSEVSHDVGLVYHFSQQDADDIRAAESCGVKLIDPARHPEQVIADITSCATIIASSLHGLIAADAFEIPNMWLWKPSRASTSDALYKFEDYYSTVGKSGKHFGTNIFADPELPDTIRREFRPPQGITAVQDRLVDAFPREFLA